MPYEADQPLSISEMVTRFTGLSATFNLCSKVIELKAESSRKQDAGSRMLQKLEV